MRPPRARCRLQILGSHTTRMLVSASTGVMNSVIGKLTSLLTDDYQLIRSTERGIRFMVDELSSMNAALERLADMEEQMDVQTREWRDKVRELSYDIEDCIDRFMQRHRNPGPGGARPNFVRKFVLMIKNVWEDRQIGKEMQELEALVVEESERRARYKIDQCFTYPQPVPLDPRAHTHYEVARNLVGIDGPREEVLGWLKEEEQKPKVVAIYGIGGSIKTTLALEVYNKIEEPFGCRAFISVSRTPDVERLLRDMLFQLDREQYEKSGMWKMEQLIRILRESLQSKRYLIVIDDIWSTSAWDHVRAALPVNNNRSRIIATTRSKDVARSCCTHFKGHMYEERPLTEDDSRVLFFGRIFSSEYCPQELRGVANEILRKCGGLPLAIISIASLLASKNPTVEVWVEIWNSISFAAEKDSPIDKMKRILFLSYFDLPHYLKTCLLYLSVFPEDYLIHSRLLIRRWIAEGLITGVNREEMELLGESYLNELINRSMILPRKIGADGTTVKFCGVHDIILDFIITQAVEDNFITILNGNGLCEYSSNKIRRLSLQLNFPEDADLPMKELSHLRSLDIFESSTLPRGKQVPQNCGSLRLLNIEGFLNFENCHIDHIGSFSQLKYLKIKGNIRELPEQIGNLQHLEVLDLRITTIRKLPATIVQLQKLVCLFVDAYVQLPDGIGNMQCLEELSKLNLREASIRSIQGIGELTKLRALEISGSSLEHIVPDMESQMEVCISSLSKLVANSLRSLYLTDFESSEVINSWVFPSGSCPPLRRLVHTKLFRTIPSKIGSLVNLTRLRIDRVQEMGEEGVKILGSLPALLSLTLWVGLGYGVRQRHFIGSQGFQRLVKFNFTGETSLIFEAGAMPKLQRLKLKLTMISQYKPGGLVQGLHHLSSIKHITIFPISFLRDCDLDEIRSATSIHPNRPIVESRSELCRRVLVTVGRPLGFQRLTVIMRKPLEDRIRRATSHPNRPMLMLAVNEACCKPGF